MFTYKGNTLIDYINWRLSKNMNFVVAVVGGTGSGKSYVSLRLAKLLDPNFCDQQICFYPEEVLALIDRKDMRHRPIIFDEAGVGIDSRKWQSTINKLLMNVFETFRSRGNVLIYTMPKLQFIDKKARNLLHAVIRTVKIEYHTCGNWCKVQLVKPLDIKDMDPLYPFMKAVVDGQVKKVKRVVFHLPPNEIIDAYEKKKDAFLTALYGNISETLKYGDLQKLAPQQQVVWDLYRSGVTSRNEAERRLNKTKQCIIQLSNAVRAKGYPLNWDDVDLPVMHERKYIR